MCGLGSLANASPRITDWCSRSAQIKLNTGASSQSPSQRSHSRTGALPILTGFMSMAQRGHFKMDSGAGVALIAAAPQCGQCLLPINSMPKHEAQAIVASFDSQYWHCGVSDEHGAEQFGQLRVCGCIIMERTH